MLIERILKEPGGAKVSFGDAATYHFKPQDDGRHVALVENPIHADRLLSIPEGYRLAGGEDPAASAALLAAVEAASHQLITADVVKAKLPIPQTADEAITLLTELEAEEPEEAALIAWPHLFSFEDEADAADGTDTEGEDAEEADGIDQQAEGADHGDGAEGTGAPMQTAWHTIGDDELREIFEKEVGRKANARAGRDTMISQIEAARRGE